MPISLRISCLGGLGMVATRRQKGDNVCVPAEVAILHAFALNESLVLSVIICMLRAGTAAGQCSALAVFQRAILR
jgi:hypothetical protein